MPYKDPLVRNARQREKYHTDPGFRLRHYEAVRKWNRTKRPKAKYKHRPNFPQRRTNYRLMVVELLMARDGDVCRYCDSSFSDVKNIVLDHILAVADGGGDEVANIQLLHRGCNGSKEADAAYSRTIKRIKEKHNV
jgi:5-methylcytosine-specific restriction endonuclease McrA